MLLVIRLSVIILWCYSSIHSFATRKEWVDEDLRYSFNLFNTLRFKPYDTSHAREHLVKLGEPISNLITEFEVEEISIEDIVKIIEQLDLSKWEEILLKHFHDYGVHDNFPNQTFEMNRLLTNIHTLQQLTSYIFFTEGNELSMNCNIRNNETDVSWYLSLGGELENWFHYYNLKYEDRTLLRRISEVTGVLTFPQAVLVQQGTFFCQYYSTERLTEVKWKMGVKDDDRTHVNSNVKMFRAIIVRSAVLIIYSTIIIEAENLEQVEVVKMHMALEMKQFIHQKLLTYLTRDVIYLINQLNLNDLYIIDIRRRAVSGKVRGNCGMERGMVGVMFDYSVMFNQVQITETCEKLKYDIEYCIFRLNNLLSHVMQILIKINDVSGSLRKTSWHITPYGFPYDHFFFNTCQLQIIRINKICPPGYLQLKKYVCIPCSPGTSQQYVKNRRTCQLCDYNYYQDQFHSITCKKKCVQLSNHIPIDILSLRLGSTRDLTAQTQSCTTVKKLNLNSPKQTDNRDVSRRSIGLESVDGIPENISLTTVKCMLGITFISFLVSIIYRTIFYK
ncbi:hypothetical protein SNEBB_001309 [Seison nebaliae]|nr:hypothetical protein SNEBB_001309 [Seison nebaliae]